MRLLRNDQRSPQAQETAQGGEGAFSPRSDGSISLTEYVTKNSIGLSVIAVGFLAMFVFLGALVGLAGYSVMLWCLAGSPGIKPARWSGCWCLRLLVGRLHYSEVVEAFDVLPTPSSQQGG